MRKRSAEDEMFQQCEGLNARIAQKEKFEREIQELELQLEKEAEINGALNYVHENVERTLNNAIHRYLKTYDETDRWSPVPASPRFRVTMERYRTINLEARPNHLKVIIGLKSAGMN